MNTVEVYGQMGGMVSVEPICAVQAIINNICGEYSNPWVEEKDGKFYVMVLDHVFQGPVIRKEITADEYNAVQFLTKALRHLNHIRDKEIENQRAYEQFKSEVARKELFD